MSLLSLASAASLWRGYEYFQDHRVETVVYLSDSHFKAFVSGNSNARYEVEIDVAHPRKSRCNCPHANGKQIICKHQVAAYFTAFPKEAETFYKDVILAQEEEEKRQEAIEEQLVATIRKMNKAELQQAMLELLFEGPEWQYDRFVRRYLE